MTWESLGVLHFWEKAIKTLTDLMGVQLPMDPVIHLTNHDSKLHLSEKSCKIWLAGLTAAKRIIVQRWKPPDDISITHWLRSFLDITYLDLSSARINDARAGTVPIWTNLITDLKVLLTNGGHKV